MEQEERSTTDIWFASFLRLNGHKVTNYEIISKNKGKFIFNLCEDSWKELRLKFDSSEISDIKLHQIALKDLLH